MSRNAGWIEAKRLWPAPLGVCEGCGERPAVDRHHKDEDPTNNVRWNVAFLCRRCHKAAHPGINHRSSGVCSNCGRRERPLRKGRCNRCRQFFARTGTEAPT